MTDKTVWFGTQERMQWVPAPASAPGVGRSLTKWRTGGQYINGGQWRKESASGARVCSLQWPVMSGDKVRKISAFLEGSYGEGPFYYSDPFAEGVNSAPQWLAAPWLASENAPRLYQTKPTKVNTPANTYDYPTYGAQYNVAGASTKKVSLPVPEGMTAHIGVHGEPHDITPGATYTNLATNPSFETAGSSVEVWRNLATNPSFEAASGTVEVRRNLCRRASPITTGSWGSNWGSGTRSVETVGAPFPGITWAKGTLADPTAPGTVWFQNTTGTGADPVTGNTLYYLSVRLTHDAVGARTGSLRVYWYDASGANLSNVVLASGISLPSGEWTEIARSATSPAGAAFALIESVIGDTGAATYLGWACGYISTTPGSWFSGDYSPDPDLTPYWLGAVNNSVSTLSGAVVPGAASSGGVSAVVQSSLWSWPAGGKSARIIPISATSDTPANLAGSQANLERFIAGRTYTVLARSRLAEPQTVWNQSIARRLRVAWNTVAGWAGTSYAYSAQAPNVAGETLHRLHFTLPANAVWCLVQAYNGSPLGGGDVWWDNLAIVEGVYTGPYFEGSGPLEYRRNYAPNPAPISASADGWLTNSVVQYPRTYDPTGGRRSGTGAHKVVRSATNPDYFLGNVYGIGLSSWVSGRISVTPGEVWTVSGYVKCSVAFQGFISVRCYDKNSIVAGPSASVAGFLGNAGEWVRVSITLTVPEGSATLGVSSFGARTVSGISVGGEETWMTDALYEKGDVLQPYFDGSYSPTELAPQWTGAANASASILYDQDLTSAWTGTANASESVLNGRLLVNVADASGGAIVSVRSEAWARSGVSSLRIIPRTSAIMTTVRVGGSSSVLAGLGVTFESGKTYTAIATCRLSAPQTGVLHPRARRIELCGNVGAGNVGLVSSDAAPNVAGEHEVRLTFTVPSNAVSAYLLLWNGASVGNGDVWWDNFAIVPGVYTGPYFDGNTPDTDYGIFNWTGAANNSTSTAAFSGASVKVNGALVPNLPVATNQLTNHTVTGPGFLDFTLDGTGKIGLYGVVVRLLPTGDPAPTGPWVKGEGYAGLQLDGDPQITGYSSAQDRQAITADFVETTPWE